jgi:hypothetical protein
MRPGSANGEASYSWISACYLWRSDEYNSVGICQFPAWEAVNEDTLPK